MNDNFKKFCLACISYDNDHGCMRSGGEIFLCPLYRHNHPEEVKAFIKACKEWRKEKTKLLGR